MYAKRIIPCLDLKDGRVVKGTNFVNLRDAGDPVEAAAAYDAAGADELVLLDITASAQGRGTVIDIVERVASQVFIPFTVGGGIRTVEDFTTLLRAGADKVSVNSAALKNPELIREAAQKFGSQCVVCAIDARRRPTQRSTVVSQRRPGGYRQGRPGMGGGSRAAGGRGNSPDQHGLRRGEKRLRFGADPGHFGAGRHSRHCFRRGRKAGALL